MRLLVSPSSLARLTLVARLTLCSQMLYGVHGPIRGPRTMSENEKWKQYVLSLLERELALGRAFAEQRFGMLASETATALYQKYGATNDKMRKACDDNGAEIVALQEVIATMQKKMDDLTTVVADVKAQVAALPSPSVRACASTSRACWTRRPRRRSRST